MLTRLALLTVLLTLLAACSAEPPTTPAPTTSSPPVGDAGPRLSVVTSTNVYGSIVAAVAGDRAEITTLIEDPAADPHSYESTPAAALAVADADLVLYNGGGYDDWVGELVQSTGGQRTVVDVTELSGLAGNEVNEHLWYRLPTMQQLAGTLAADLGTLDPAHAAEYTANAAEFVARTTDEVIVPAQAIGTAHPGARVAVTEPVPGYLIETAGLTDATPPAFAEAVEEDTDPPAAVLAQALALFDPDPVRALILNSQTESPTTDQLRTAAQNAGVPVIEFTETLPPGQTDYLNWMRDQVDELAAALNRA